MLLFYIIALILAVLLLGTLITAYICFRMAFYVPRRKQARDDAILLPEGKVYEPFWDRMEKWIRQTRAMPYEDMMVTSFDGLQLHGKFYEFAPGAPIELMFHGYRGSAERDLCGGIQRCFKLGRSCLIVDQRGSGQSQGNVITFGICEHRDCLSWLEFMVAHFGKDVKIILTGLSMGASTVLMVADKPLPENVMGILADCGYTSAKEIIKKVIGSMKLPAELIYPFVKLGAKLYGGFDLEESSALEAMKKCTVPVIFFHGEQDDYVPCRMSRINYRACTARKMLVTVPGAGHGLSYPVAPEAYLDALREFFGDEASY